MITPQDIQNKEFREAFRGYNEDDVDTFLDEIAEEYGRVYVENQRLRIQLATVQQEAAQRGGMPAALLAPMPSSAAPTAPAAKTERAEAREEMKRALVATQRASEAALEEAKRRAGEILARAEQRAKEIDELTARRAKDIDVDASSALTYAQQRVEELRRQETEIRMRLKRMLSEHVKVLQQLEGEAVAAQAPRSIQTAPTPPPLSADPAPVAAPPAQTPPAGDLPLSGQPPHAASAPAPAASAPPATPRDRKPLWLGGQPRKTTNGLGGRPAPQMEPPGGSEEDRRAAVVERMTRELGDAANPRENASQRAGAQPRESFWKT